MIIKRQRPGSNLNKQAAVLMAGFFSRLNTSGVIPAVTWLYHGSPSGLIQSQYSAQQRSLLWTGMNYRVYPDVVSSPSIMFTSSSQSFCCFWTDMWRAAGCLCSLSIKHLKVSVRPGWRLFTHCFMIPSELLCSSQCGRWLICLQCELLYNMFGETLFNGEDMVSCSWLLNAECCISLFTATPMSHSYGTFWFPVLSPSVFFSFLCLMFFWSNHFSQCMASLWSTIIVIACIQTHLVSQ